MLLASAQNISCMEALRVRIQAGFHNLPEDGQK